MTRSAAIFDMDGTLCDVTGIRHLLGVGKSGRRNKRNFDAFHEESVNCPPNDWVLRNARWLNDQDVAIIVVTARKSRWFNVTWWWLRENGVPFDRLYMRDDWDQRKDAIVKGEILDRIWREGFDPVIAYDDNPNVIALWEASGIPTVRVPGWID